jgi:hypothetical protein
VSGRLYNFYLKLSANGQKPTFQEVTDVLQARGWGGSDAMGAEWVERGLKKIRREIYGP